MKNLLIVLAILMLACGSETEVAEESTPTEEKLVPIVDVIDDGEPIEILKPDFLRDDAEAGIRLDPVPLNQNGIFFEFSKDLDFFQAALLLEDDTSLGWLPREAVTGDDIGASITLKPPAAGPFLEYDSKYTLNLEVRDGAGKTRIRVKTLRTMRKP